MSCDEQQYVELIWEKHIRAYLVLLFFLDVTHTMTRDTQCGITTVLPARSDSDFVFCLHSYQGLIIDRSLVY